MDTLQIKSDGPTEALTTIKFANWKDEHGLVIRKEELETAAKKFRMIARLVTASAGQNQEYLDLSDWLVTLADQFQNASCGYEAMAEAQPYDQPAADNAAETGVDDDDDDDDSDDDDDDDDVKKPATRAKKKVRHKK